MDEAPPPLVAVEPSGDAPMDAASSPAETAAALRDTATALYKSGNYTGASAAYGAALGALGEPLSALTASDAALAVTLLTNRAAASLSLKRYGDAVEDCRRALLLDATNVRALTRKAKAELALGSVEAAISSLSAATAADPGNAAVKADRAAAQGAWRRVCEARGAESEGDWERVATLTASLCESCPASARVRLQRAEALLALGRLDAALAATTELLTMVHAADAERRGGGAGVGEGEGAAAAASGGDAVDMGLVLIVRARVMNYQGHAAGAMKLLTEALRNDPDCGPAARLMRSIKKGEALKEQGNAAFKASKWDDACTAYSAALELDPKNKVLNAKLHANRAAALIKASKAGEAMEDLNACVLLDPTYVKGYLRRAQAAMVLGDVDSLNGAIRDYSSAKELLGASPTAAGGARSPSAASSGDNADNRDVLREVEAGLRSARAALKQAKRKDYYKLLDVDKSADEEALKKAYKRAALKWHPDRHSCASEADKRTAEAKFKEISEANDILGDPDKRAAYDRSLETGEDFDPNDEGGCCGGGGGGGGGPFRGGGGMGAHQDIFQMLFAAQMAQGMGGGGGHGHGMGGMPRGFQPRRHH